MRILIDGDGCPQKEQVINVANEHHMKVILFVDYAHVMNDVSCELRYCEIGQDSVDLMIANEVQSDDLVITQDYGLASLVLHKGAKVLHVNGFIIDTHNIDELLYQRYLGYQNRKFDKHIKGPKKRTLQDQNQFIDQLKLLIEENSI